MAADGLPDTGCRAIEGPIHGAEALSGKALSVVPPSGCSINTQVRRRAAHGPIKPHPPSQKIDDSAYFWGNLKWPGLARRCPDSPRPIKMGLYSCNSSPIRVERANIVPTAESPHYALRLPIHTDRTPSRTAVVPQGAVFPPRRPWRQPSAGGAAGGVFASGRAAAGECPDGGQ
jgi:hypothetical protein